MLLCGLLACLPSYAHAQFGQTIAEVRVEQEGRVVTDPALIALIETRVGEPLSMREVVETSTDLMSLGRFEDVRTESEPVAGGERHGRIGAFAWEW